MSAVTITVPEPVAAAMAAACHAQQGSALHFAGRWASLADTGNYTDVERARLRELVSEFTLIAEHMRDALEALCADVHVEVAA